LGTPYPAIVKDVQALMERPPLPGCRLVVDATGVGRAVVDLFRGAKLPALLVPVTITSGRAEVWQRDGYHVAKVHLVGVMQALLGQGRLKISPLKDGPTLLKELRVFKVKVNVATGTETFEAWRERDHDDMVLSVALPCWLAERGKDRFEMRIYHFGARNPAKQKLRLVVASRQELAALEVEKPAALIHVADPAPVGNAELPPHALAKLAGSLVLQFGDMDAEDYAQTEWLTPIAPYGRPAHELIVGRDHAVKVWAFVNRVLSGKHHPPPEALVFSDEGDRRALSVALAVCDGLRLPRSVIHLVGDPDRKHTEKDERTNPHVHRVIREARYAVVA
jgi:hypothetical protein